MSKRRVEIGYDGGAAAAAAVPKDNGILPSDSLRGGSIVVRTDNAALALCTILKGQPLYVDGRLIAASSSHDIPEGHRFATEDIAAGGEICSWGIPFGVALLDLKAGDYLANLKSIANFQDRQSSLALPTEPSFRNASFKRFKLQKEDFVPGPPTAEMAPKLSEAQLTATFMGYARGGIRGAGTRNYVVLIGVSSQAGAFVRALEAEYHHVTDAARKYGTQTGCDGVVAVAHTEGGLDSSITSNAVPNNMNKVVRTLAGFVVNPNVSAVLLVDQGSETVRAEHIQKFLVENQYPTAGVMIETLRLAGKPLDAALAEGRTKIDAMLETVRRQQRQPVLLKELILALQCGGSDAFSGISANPLAGWMARYLTCCGGAGLLAETDELIGAEGYILHSVRDFETADHFLQLVDRYYRYTNHRGHSPEGNPSGGNLYRGLYNITLKSAGAAMKKLPDVRLDHVIEYGELLRRHGSGYAFMDSPGNDLESIAGQVGAGSNMILFTTGNGSVTNFPFVPTLKALTTTKRYELLSDDMDINAGLYLDQQLTLDQLGEQAISLLIRAASGQYTKGEIAGHHQVQIWRDWNRLESEEAAWEQSRMDPSSQLQQASAAEVVTHGAEQHTADDEQAGQPLKMMDDNSPVVTELVEKLGQSLLWPTQQQLSVLPSAEQVSDKLGLVLPTSLCSGQVAVILVRRLNEKLEKEPEAFGVSRFVTLPHTEGCGHSSGSQESLVVRTMVSYAVHPLVVHAVMLEHGCEKTHNGRLEQELQAVGAKLERYGFASVQLDGGLEKVAAKVEAQFRQLQAKLAGQLPVAAERQPLVPSQLRVGFFAALPVEPTLQHAVGMLAQAICRGGGTVVLAGSLKGGGVLQNVLKDGKDVDSTLGFGQRAAAAGLHIMGTSSLLPVELMTGLGATGVEVMVAVVRGEAALPAHPMIPVVQVAVASNSVPQMSLDLDLVLTAASAATASGDEDSTAAAWAAQLAAALAQCLSRASARLPKLYRGPISDFQMPRTTGSVSM